MIAKTSTLKMEAGYASCYEGVIDLPKDTQLMSESQDLNSSDPLLLLLPPTGSLVSLFEEGRGYLLPHTETFMETGSSGLSAEQIFALG